MEDSHFTWAGSHPLRVLRFPRHYGCHQGRRISQMESPHTHRRRLSDAIRWVRGSEVW